MNGMMEVWIVFYLAVVGALVLAWTCPMVELRLAFPILVPAGLVAYSVFAFCAITILPWVDMHARVIAGMVTPIVALAMLGGVKMGWRDYSIAVARLSAIGIGMSAALLLLRMAWDPAFILGDTILQSAYIHDLYAGSDSSSGVSGLLSNWSLSYITLNMLAVWANFVYFSYSPQIATVVFIWAMLNILVGVAGRKAILAFLLVAFFGVLMAGTPYFLLSLSFIGSNIWFSIFAALFVSFVLREAFSTTEEQKPVSVSGAFLGICLLGMALSRVEGVLYSSILIVWLVLSEIFDVKAIRKIVIPQVVVVILVKTVSAAYGLANESGMLSPYQLALLIIGYSLWIPFCYVVIQRLNLGIIRSIWAAGIGISVILVLTVVGRIPEFHSTLSAIGTNVLAFEIWGILPILFIVIGILSPLMSSRFVVPLLVQAIIALILIVALISLGRTPYYVNIADSGHRIIGSFIILAIMALAAFAHDIVMPKKMPDRTHTNPT